MTLAGVVGVLAAGYVALGMGTLQQGLNGFISALLFNIIYDIIISNKLKWCDPSRAACCAPLAAVRPL